MTSTASTAPGTSPGEDGISRLRRRVLRATYLLLIIGLGATVVPAIFSHEPAARGVIPSLLCGLWLMAFVGLRYPLRMLPILMFEFAWKAIWLAAFGFAQWRSGQTPPTFGDDFPAIVFGVVLMPFVLPWGYVWRNYVKAAGDRWRNGPSGRFWKRGDDEVSLARLYVMRAVALLGIWGLLPTIGSLFEHAPMDRGVHNALIAGLWLMAIFSLRYPLKMVPILLFEMVWKLVWLFAFGLPQWLSGVGSPRLDEDLWSIGAFPLVVALVIPWGHVWRRYLRTAFTGPAPSEVPASAALAGGSPLRKSKS